jgi:hypothetical protein
VPEIRWPAGKGRARRLFAARAPAEETGQAGVPPWLSGLSAPDPLARWASSFGDLGTCWDACRDPEWLMWLAARTCSPGQLRRPVVLCAAEFASLAGSGRRDPDPRVTAAISAVRRWAESGMEKLDLLDAEWGAEEAAQEAEQTAGREAKRALVLLRSAPRHRLSSSGMSRALDARQRWREAERAGWLALSAAFAARAARQAEDASVTAAEWASWVSQAADHALRVMPGERPRGGHPGCIARRRCLRIARRLLTAPAAPLPGSASLSGMHWPSFDRRLRFPSALGPVGGT